MPSLLLKRLIAQQEKHLRHVRQAEQYCLVYPEFKILSQTLYQNPLETIVHIENFLSQTPGPNVKIFTLMLYYVVLNPTISGKQKWVQTAQAWILKNSNIDWLNFFNHDYQNLDDLLSHIPKTKYSKSLIMNYYFLLKPHLYERRQWGDLFSITKLHSNNSLWKNFLDKKFQSFDELLENIPKEFTQSLSTIVSNYLLMNPDTKDLRNWQSQANALTLKKNHSEWEFFFNTKFNNPQSLIQAIPKHNVLSITTLFGYYLALNPHIKNNRAWLDYAAAIKLSEENPEWNKFFENEYESALELLHAMPQVGNRSTSTLIKYYVYFHPHLKHHRSISLTVLTINFILNNPYFQKYYATRKDFQKLKDELNLNVSYEVFRKYIHRFHTIDFNLKSFKRFNPGLNFFETHLNLKQEVIQQIHENKINDEIVRLKTITKVLREEKISRTKFKTYLELIRKYIALEILDF